MKKSISALVLSFALLVGTLPVRAGDDELSAGKINHVLLISVDGLHALDLTNFVASHQQSTLAQLSGHGFTYTNASTSLPTDSFPGLAALVTGGSPQTTGFWYDVTYNRALVGSQLTAPAGYVMVATQCPGPVGTPVGLDEEIDVDLTQLNGGRAQTSLTDAPINPGLLPRDPITCAPIYPHQYLRVNTIFEVIKANGGYTAWTDKHPSYEWVKGPSGQGLDDFYSPEINSLPVNLPQVKIWPCNPIPDVETDPGSAWTDTIGDIKCYDALKVQAIVNEIDGLSHDGSVKTQVPAVFGMNFQAVSVGEKLVGNGYSDVLGTPGEGPSGASAGDSGGLLGELEFVDQMLSLMVNELKKQGLLSSTLIIVGAKHGQSPIDVQKKVPIGGGQPQTLIGSPEAFDISDDGSLIWLIDPTLTPGVVQQLSTPESQATLGIQEIFAGPSLRNKWDSPTDDPRTPDIILKVNTGVIFTGGSKIAEHGGLNEDDYHVALLVSNPSLSPKTIKSPVTNQQVAPTIVKVLGFNPNELQAVRKEQTRVLPFLFSDSDSDDK